MGSSSWREAVLVQLKERDAKERTPFETIINSHVALWSANQVLARQRDKLRAAASSATTNSASTGDSMSAAPSASNTKELEKKIELLQAELTATYKKEAKEATSQLALEAELRQVQSNEQAAKAAMERLRIKLKETQALLEEEQRSGGRAREEATTLRDELLRVRKLLELSENKNRQLAKDNANLLERILSEKLKMADELNQMSQMYEELQGKLKQRESEPQSPASVEKKQALDEQVEKLNVEETDTKGSIKGGFKRSQSETVAQVGMRGPIAHSSSEQVSEVGDDAVPSIPTRMQAHDSEVPMIRYDESGSQLFTCSCDGTIKIWDALLGVLLKTLRCPIEVQLMGMDVKQKVVIATGSDRALRVWSLETERVFHTLTGHASKLYACRLTSDARTAISGGTDRKVMIWDINSGNRVRLISCSSIVNAVAVSEDGSYIATGHQDTSVRMWDLRSGKMALAVTDCHTNTVTSVEFTRSGKILTNSRDNTLALVDLVAGKTDVRLADPSYKTAYNWSSADTSSTGAYVGAAGSNGSAYLWHLRGSSLAKANIVLEHGEKRLAAFAFNPTGGGKCATADENGLLVLWKPKKS